MRNTFDLSHEHKTSLDMGELVPIMCEEVLPGDTWIQRTSLLARVAPLVSPVMHNVDVRVHHWYVPNRIVWSDWEGFITGSDELATMPTVQPSTTAEAELLDYMGAFPSTSLTYQALPVRAYNAIWNNFYRDQDLAAERTTDQLGIARIAWGKDYFTTARSAPQQGDAVQIGFNAATAPVEGIGTRAPGASASTPNVYETDASTAQTLTGWHSGSDNIFIEEDSGNTGYPNVRVNLANASGGIDITELRRSLALQRMAEARMRFGERYVDYLRFLGVNPSSGLLDRPEYLGGGSQTINFSEVLATAEGTTTAVGDLYGHGIAGLKARRFRKMFEEHGWVLTLLSVRPRTVYQEALPKKFKRTTMEDYWQRELEVLPWQEVDQTEVYALGTPGTIFGYAPRYNEYRHAMSHVSGTFRQGTEEDWHLAREFGGAPTLNESFITCTPSDRIYSDTAMPEILVSAYHNIKARRLVRASAQLGGI